MENEDRKRKIQKCKDNLNKLMKGCPHTEFVVEKSYSSGGYDYYASTTYSKRCKTCNTVFDLYTEEHAGIYG